VTVARDAFKTTLRAMYDADEGKAGLVFSRERVFSFQLEGAVHPFPSS